MSVNVVPAAVPDPNDPANPAVNNPAAGPLAGLLASMVAPVQPARTTFNLTPATATTPDPADPGDGTNPATGNVSSASFHDDEGATNDTKNSTTDNASGKAQTGIWRAWLIAGATRWGRGGGTANKRLDAKKAKAQAQQVKETRQVTINRSPSGGSGSGRGTGTGAAGPAGGKGLGGKSGPGASNASKMGPKNTGPGSKGSTHGPSGNGGRSGQGPAGGRGPSGGGAGSTGRGSTGGRSGAGTENSPAPKRPKPPKGDTPTAPRPSKDSTGTSQRNGKPTHPGSGTSGSRGSAGTSGTAGKDGASPKQPTSPAGASGNKPADTNSTKTDKAAPAGRKKWSLVKGDKATSPNADKTGKAPASDSSAKTDTGKTKPGTKTSDSNTQKDPKTTAPPGGKPSTGRGKSFSTEGSRTTGYRDGTRLAKVNAHAKAYTDGVKDGWTAVSDAAAREKTRLDQAHALRKQQLEQDREQPVSASSADHHQAQPIQVTGVDNKTVFLGDGAARESLTRGEVRSLKGFERRLEAKVSVLLKAAEQAKTLQAHAGEQAKEATQYMEQARTAKAGEKVIASLQRTQEAAAAQIRAAEDLYKRAVRGVEQSSAVLANVKTRYEALYTAVVNSPETRPAEMSFYQDGALAHA